MIILHSHLQPQFKNELFHILHVTNPYISNVTQQCRCSPMLTFRTWLTCGPVCFNQSVNSALYRKDRHCNTAHTCNTCYCWKVLKNKLVFVVLLLSLGTQSYNQVKKEFTSAVLLDIIPHGPLYVLKFAVIWFFVDDTNKWQINLTELM